MANKPKWGHQRVYPNARSYTCGYCGLSVASNVGTWWGDTDQPGLDLPSLYICPHCNKPTYFGEGNQMPGVAFGNEVAHLPPEVDGLYREARNCMTVSAFTAGVLATRKLLMNVAASLGAAPGESFQSYVTYLESHGYVPPKARGWVDHIRKKGNEATHEIPPIVRSDAEELITFMEMILKLVYDYPARAPPSLPTGS